jgi:hypothetical protein
MQTHNNNGELDFFILQWKCDACGCEWIHGQFMVKANNKSPPPFISIHEGGKMTIDGRGFEVLSVTESGDRSKGRYTIEIQAK